jgi:hypothetical protein
LLIKYQQQQIRVHAQKCIAQSPILHQPKQHGTQAIPSAMAAGSAGVQKSLERVNAQVGLLFCWCKAFAAG